MIPTMPKENYEISNGKQNNQYFGIVLELTRN